MIVMGLWGLGAPSRLMAQPSFLADTVGQNAFTGRVAILMRAGDAAFAREEFIVSTDRYNRALVKETNENKLIRIYYKLGLTRQKLNHPEAAYNAFRYMYDKGERSREFLRAYMQTLFAMSHYNEIDTVIAVMEKYQMPVDHWQKMLILSREATDSGAPVYPKSVLIYDSALNTSFSEYGCVKVSNDEIVFTSTRPLEGETTMDPRTGHSYSRLYTATYNPSTETWVKPRLVQGPFKDLKGNIGTFSYDHDRQIGYFMWSQVDKSGVYTVKRQGDGNWGDLAEFQFNHYELGPNFIGTVGQPAVSPNGNRLLFVVKDSNNTGSDIWYMERFVAPPAVEAPRKRKVASPSARSKSAEAKAKPKAKPKEEISVVSPLGALVQVNKDWGAPIHLDSTVNTKYWESFPQWINDTCFAFASDGHVGMGGLDIYLATFDKKRRQASKVKHIPAPVNSSFDDHGLVWDSIHGKVLFSSNRYTKYGSRDHLYIGPDYLLFPHPDAPIDSTDLLAELEAQRIADSLLAADSLRVLDSLMAIQDSLHKMDSLLAADSLSKLDSLLAQDSIKPLDSLLAQDSISPLDSLMANQDSIAPLDSLPTLDSTSLADMPPLDSLLSADSLAPPFSDTTNLADMPPLQDSISPPPLNYSDSAFESFFGMDINKPTEKQDLTQYLNDSMTAKQIIDSISKHRKDVERVDSRYVNDYQKRMSDPLRRTKLQVVPPGVKCEACEEKSRQRPADQPFFVRTNDDKALITLTDQAGKISYIDVAPNAAYQFEIVTMGEDGKPSLPKSVEMSDLRRTVVTRDYILFECTPKLSELNEETYINNLYFDFDDDSLIRDAYREIDRMIIVAIKNPNMMFEIEAHADERGSMEYNQKLTDRRLANTMAYIEKKGFDTERIVPRSYSKSRPLIVNAHTEEEHRLNRRVSFRLFNPKAENIISSADYPLTEQPLTYSEKVYFKVQLGAFRRPLEKPEDYYKDVLVVDPSYQITYYMDKDGLYKYNVGNVYTDVDDARAVVRRLLDHNRECYIAAFYKGNRITVSEALAVIKHEQEKAKGL